MLSWKLWVLLILSKACCFLKTILGSPPPADMWCWDISPALWRSGQSPGREWSFCLCPGLFCCRTHQTTPQLHGPDVCRHSSGCDGPAQPPWRLGWSWIRWRTSAGKRCSWCWAGSCWKVLPPCRGILNVAQTFSPTLYLVVLALILTAASLVQTFDKFVFFLRFLAGEDVTVLVVSFPNLDKSVAKFLP